MRDKPKAGDRVVLVAIPAGLLDGLPVEDQRAIESIVGRPVTLVGYDDDGRVELQFDDPFDVRTETSSNTHFIWVLPEFVEPYGG
jgi:hypothetical protein